MNILKKVTSFCETNNLCYFLAYGTLLGAIRHKGYIPWDDDIDIFIPRKDYEKFVSTFRDNRIKVLDFRYDKEYLYPFSKATDSDTLLVEKSSLIRCKGLGVNIDIFPLDNIPNSFLKRKAFIAKNKLFRYVFVSKAVDNSNNKWYKKIVAFFINFFTKRQSLASVLSKWNKHMMKYANIDTKFVGCVAWGYGKKEIVNRNVFYPMSIASFEGLPFKIPGKYDFYLKKIYGNYMCFPPESERVTHHFFDAYRK